MVCVCIFHRSTQLFYMIFHRMTEVGVRSDIIPPPAQIDYFSLAPDLAEGQIR